MDYQNNAAIAFSYLVYTREVTGGFVEDTLDTLHTLTSIDILPALKDGDSYKHHVLRRYSRWVLAADLFTGSLDKRAGGVPACGITLDGCPSTFQNIDRPNHIGIVAIATFNTLKFGLG